MKHPITTAVLLGAGLMGSVSAVLASGPSFPPDKVIDGSSLTGWTSLGGAKWVPGKDGISGTSDGSGGWLMLNQSYQDVSLYTEFQCDDACETGVLLRAEKTPDGGMKGYFVSLGETSLPTYAVKISPEGQITSRELLARGGALQRTTPPPAKPQERSQGNAPRRAQENPVVLPIHPEDTSLKPHAWNSVEVFFDANTIRSFLNNGRQEGAIAEDGGYGPIALYSGGKGTVHFRHIVLADISLKVRDEEKVGPGFRKQRLNDFYYSWGTAAADFNHDGTLDVISGPYIYYGPDYQKSREIYY